jgi:PAS domain S-box-containing protein
LKELLQQADSRSEEAGREKFVYLIVNATEYEYSGNWQWDLHCDAVFCSDVMLSQPQPFEGTRGLIHPDDKAYVADRLAPPDGTEIPFLQFRIITTYGEIKTLTGKNLQASEIGPFQALPAPGPAPQPVADLSILEENQKLTLQKRAADLAERFTGTGTWYYDAGTGSVYYSDEVFRIHGLPRQSLNAHLGTFTSFIHPDDRDAVSEAFTRALKKQVPLHLEYRILAENGKEKRVHHATHWEYSPAGHQVLYGTFQDITETYALEQNVQTAGFDLHFKNQLLHLNEQASQTGYWYVNLVTRKVFYSDAVYRLYGLKPGSVPPSGNIFLNYVHPDDRDLVTEVSKKILKQHVPPDIDFRVVRNDGKVRHLRQQGRIVVYGEGEMVMLVSVRDVTTEIITAQKLAELKTTSGRAAVCPVAIRRHGGYGQLVVGPGNRCNDLERKPVPPAVGKAFRNQSYTKAANARHSPGRPEKVQ